MGCMSHAELHNVFWLFVSNHLFMTCFLICFALTVRDELLNPENDTVGILVSAAVEITVGGKTIKPAGGLMLSM